ncbi:MAG: hypothetical protein OQJ87_11355 [Rhodospirillales bacterium]|nr:hypothetical protein [Rhodospirillales bacterium]
MVLSQPPVGKSTLRMMMKGYEQWFAEFSAEITHDHRELLQCRESKSRTSEWSFDVAVEKTRDFYRERFNGFARCNSIDLAELKSLLRMVETLGTPKFPC